MDLVGIKFVVLQSGYSVEPAQNPMRSISSSSARLSTKAGEVLEAQYKRNRIPQFKPTDLYL